MSCFFDLDKGVQPEDFVFIMLSKLRVEIHPACTKKPGSRPGELNREVSRLGDVGDLKRPHQPKLITEMYTGIRAKVSTVLLHGSHVLAS